MYWSSQTRISQIANIETCDRWKMPNRDNPLRDKLFKICPILNHILSKFQALPQEQVLYMDEPIVLFKDHSSLKQYLPKKPTKLGYMIFMLCDAHGLPHNSEVYAWKILSSLVILTYNQVGTSC